MKSIVPMEELGFPAFREGTVWGENSPQIFQMNCKWINNRGVGRGKGAQKGY